jgi:hypothetical protein
MSLLPALFRRFRVFAGNRTPMLQEAWNMRLLRWMPFTLLGCQIAGAAGPDVGSYPSSPERQQANAARVATDRQTASALWKAAPLVYYEVPAISPVKRLPDAYPADGRLLGPLRIIAAQGEFEPASFVVYPFQPVAKLDLKAGNLIRGAHTIPAAALDIKIVKVWYQAGSAWHGYFGDNTQRAPTPELLLNDETLIRVDHNTRDNYVRYACHDGSAPYAWMSFRASAVNHSRVGLANIDLIQDSPILQSAALEPGAFKQFFVTVGVPAQATPGVYQGAIALIADGQEIGKIPVTLRVLPFQLPRLTTYYDDSKEFYGGVSCQPLDWRKPKVLRNLKNHGVRYPGLPNYPSKNPKLLGAMVQAFREAGLPVTPPCGGVSANILADDPPTPAQQERLDTFRRMATAAVEASEKLTGYRTLASYGYDEAGPEKMRMERACWRIVHEIGGKVSASAYAHGRLLYNVDALSLPGMPVEKRKKAVDLCHAANPDMRVKWYANPHSGPENPDYFRRLHGLMTYKANYDAVGNYVWYRNDWNDFWVPAESGLRGLMMVYPTKDNVIDTLAWEGIREALDDIGYATKLKQLATQALRSRNVDISYAGRKALAWLASWDETREDLAAGRLEMIASILDLDSALKGDN